MRQLSPQTWLNPRSWFKPHWLRQRAVALALILVLSLLMGYLAAEGKRVLWEEQFINNLSHTTTALAARLEVETMASYAVGVARLLGLNEPRLRELVLGQWEQDAPEVLERLIAARRLLEVDGIYVLNAEGLVLAHETHEATRTTGRNLAFRPWFDQAMQGETTLYAAVGSRSLERGLYIASPLHETADAHSPVIGVILLKTPGDFLDQRLANAGHHGLLVAPQGVVFAATESRWLLHLAGEKEPERLEALAALRQFGAGYAQPETIHQLPFSLDQHIECIQERRFGFATASLDWNDPAGHWTLVQFENLALVSSPGLRSVVGTVAAMTTFVLGWILWSSARLRWLRTEALAQQEAAIQEVAEASRQKQQVAEFTLQMQEAESLETLSEVFFRQLTKQLAIHQATLYMAEEIAHATTEDAVDTEDTGENAPVAIEFRLIGAYGINNAPERIAAGEGLIAECGQRQHPLIITDPPAGFWRIATGLGATAPRSLLLFPLVRKQRLLGVLELASVLEPERIQTVLIEDLLPLLAVNLDVHLMIQRDAEVSD